MRGLFISSLLVSIGLFIGRILGFFRETFIASNFGATGKTDLIIVFLSAPDILVNLLVGGALGMALIPEFKLLGHDTAKLLYQQIIMLLMSVFTIISICAYLFSAEILSAFAPGISEVVIHKYNSTFAITFLAFPLTVAAGVTTAFLQSRGKFFIPALGTAIFNLVLICTLYMTNLFDAEYILLIVSIGVFVAASLRWFSQVINSRVIPFSIKSFNRNLVSAALLRRYGYGVLTGGLIFMIPVVTRAIASESGPGELSLVNYAMKLVEFPLGVVITVFSIIFFPLFAQIFAEGYQDKFLTLFKRVIYSVIAISLAVFIPLQHFSFSIVTIVYDWGQLSAEQIDNISLYFNSVVRTLPFQGVNALLIAALASRRDTLSSFFCSSCVAILFFTVGYSSIHHIDELFDLLVLTYVLLSILLILVLIIKHKINFITCSFTMVCIKLLSITVVYWWCLSGISFTKPSIWLDMLVATVTCIVFLVACVFINKDVRQLILKKVSKCSI